MLRTICVSAILLVCFFISGCRKEKTPRQPSKFSSTLLTAHSWKIKSLLYRKKDDATNSDLTDAVYKPCEKDDIYIFSADSSFTRDDNTDVCGITGVFGPYGVATWVGDNNDNLTQITISAFYYSYAFLFD